MEIDLQEPKSARIAIACIAMSEIDVGTVRPGEQPRLPAERKLPRKVSAVEFDRKLILLKLVELRISANPSCSLATNIRKSSDLRMVSKESIRNPQRRAPGSNDA